MNCLIHILQSGYCEIQSEIFRLQNESNSVTPKPKLLE